MRINHNIAALNTHRQMGQANQGQQASMEKLSSGLRINKAGDDAAGLAISEKMRGQIRGLDQASRNSQDGISMIQTAEGALNETHDILQRMRELSVQSGNDTNTDTDRKELQKEVDQLSEELTRISDDTEFNTQKLLDGSFEGTFQIGSNEGQDIGLSIDDMSSKALGSGFEETAEELAASDLGAVEAGGDYSVVSFDKLELDGSGNNDLDGAQYGLENSDGELVAYSTDGKDYTSLDSAVALDDIDTDTASGSTTMTFGSEVKSGSVSISETYKDDADADVVDATATGGINISTQADAGKAITDINNAIESVSAQRSELGAYQNRLDHTINNLGTSSENLTAAESRIRDVDMAEEQMNQTKNSILGQASQAMMAQANQLPQGVLQLLQ